MCVWRSAEHTTLCEGLLRLQLIDAPAGDARSEWGRGTLSWLLPQRSSQLSLSLVQRSSDTGRSSPLPGSRHLCESGAVTHFLMGTITIVRKIEDGFRFDKKNFTFGGEPAPGISVGGRPFLGDFPRRDRYPSGVKVDLGGKGREQASGATSLWSPEPHLPTLPSETLQQRNAERWGHFHCYSRQQPH